MRVDRAGGVLGTKPARRGDMWQREQDKQRRFL